MTTSSSALRLLDELNGLKGLVMKFGQMASYLDHSLPPKAQKILARLQSESQPMAPEVAAAVIESEFGATPGQVFEHFEAEPFAAASIGQVHRATFQGQAVAVKVQYPGIVEALESDLKMVSRFASIGSLLSSLDGKALASELGERILEECDYASEANNQTLFHELFAGDSYRCVPSVIRARSTSRVLTSEFDEGQRFSAFLKHHKKFEIVLVRPSSRLVSPRFSETVSSTRIPIQATTSSPKVVTSPSWILAASSGSRGTSLNNGWLCSSDEGRGNDRQAARL